MSTCRTNFTRPHAAPTSTRLWRRAAVALLACVATVVMPTRALAQLQSVPTETIAAQGLLTAEQKAQIEKFATDNIKGLSGDAKAIRESRTTLMSPLTSGQVGVPFRTEYSELLLRSLPDLVTAGGVKGVNAILLAGEVATARSLDLVESMLDNSEPAIRFAAASATNASFEQVRTKSPSLSFDRIRNSLGKLAARLGTEQDQLVVDAITRSMLNAARIEKPGYEALRSTALDALAKALADRLAATPTTNKDSGILQATLRAMLTMRDELANDERNRGGAGGSRLSTSAYTSIATCAGETLALSARLIKDPELVPVAGAEPDETARVTKARAVIGQLAGSAATVINLAGPLLGAAVAPSAANLGALAREAKNASDAQFLTTITELVGPGGVLSKPPFSITRTFKLP